jgi:hypothetical protein
MMPLNWKKQKATYFTRSSILGKEKLMYDNRTFQIHPVIRLEGPASPVPMQTNEQVVSL